MKILSKFLAKKMKILGIFLMVLFVGLAIYLGGYICLFGGIIKIVEGIQAEPNIARMIAWGVVRVILAGFTFWGLFLIGLFCLSIFGEGS